MNELENTKEYEMSYFLTPEILEDKTDIEIEELKKIIVKNGGEIIQVDPLEKKRLAYPVKKQNYAYFGVVYFCSDSDGVDKIKKNLFLYKKIIRFLILNEVAKSKPKPVVIQGSKPEEALKPTQSFDQKLESILKR